MSQMIFNSIMGTLDQFPYVPRSKMVMAEGTAMALQAGLCFSTDEMASAHTDMSFNVQERIQGGL